MATLGLTQENGPAKTRSASTTPTTFPSPTSSGGHAVALGVTLGLVGMLIAGAITYFVVRMRRLRAEEHHTQGGEEKHLRSAGRKSTVLDTRHPASRVTPFSNHTPGANMRIARRRQDGAWVFEEPSSPNSPFTPEGISDPNPIHPAPSTAPSSTTSSPRWPGQPGYSKFAEAQAETDARRERDARRDTARSSVTIGPPPPAYYPDDSSDGYTQDSSIN